MKYILRKRIQNKLKITFILLLIGVFVFIFYNILPIKSHYLFKKSIINYIQDVSGKPMIVKNEINAIYNNKKYLIILSTPINEPAILYVNCFEEKLFNLFYKSTYGVMQGNSRYLYGMLINFINDGTGDCFYIIYGYNKDKKATSFEIQIANTNNFIKVDISSQEYFLYTFENIVYPQVILKDRNNNDISSYFINKT